MYDYALGAGAWWLQAHNVGLTVASLCYATSLWFSWAEIEIEGAFAWQMSNTHTWRWQWDACGEGGICGNGLALTGYHLTQFTTALFFVFSTWIATCVLYGHPVLWSTACLLASMYVLTVTLEDNGWYTYNMEFAWAKARYGTKDPFGGFVNRIGRYVSYVTIFSLLWYAGFLLQALEVERGWIASASSHQGDPAYMAAFATAAYAFLVAYSVTFMILERWTLLPLYKRLRTYLVRASIRVDEVAQNATFSGLLSNHIVAKGDAYRPPAEYTIDLRTPLEKRRAVTKVSEEERFLVAQRPLLLKL